MKHMVDASESIARFIAGRERAQLDEDEMLLFAVVRGIEVIGEAASRVSDETQLSATGIPWRAIVGMRNRIVHAYFDIDRDIVWKAATVEVPSLAAMLRGLIEERE